MKIKTLFSFILVVVIAGILTVPTFARTVYYASSGTQSGYVQNGTKSSTCVFNNLPSGNMKVSYSTETSTTLEIRFYRNASLTGGYYSANVYNSPTGNTATVSLASSGTYYVVVCPKNNSASTFYYAYDLYRD